MIFVSHFRNLGSLTLGRNKIVICGRVVWLKNLTPYVLSRCFASRNELSLKNPVIQNYVDSLTKEFNKLNQIGVEEGSSQHIAKRLAEIKPVIDIQKQKQSMIDCLSSLQELNSEGNSNDADFQKQLNEEKQEYNRKIEELDEKLLSELLPEVEEDVCSKVMMEINAGVGGQEAMLFAQELFDMYRFYIEFKGWTLENYDHNSSELGGLRQATLFISGQFAYKLLKHEAGVHRVQRIPATEKSGRLHTSTVAVRVLPQTEEREVEIDEKDLRIETKRASGAGGQHVNKTESAVRITHLPTGISVESQTDRSQIRNKKEAMQKLHALLYKKMIDEETSSLMSARKAQVKSNFRSEKIRTYNFQQDRLTDHRIGGNVHNLPEFMNGNASLDKLIERLEINNKKELLFQKIQEADPLET